MAEFCLQCWNKINGTTYKSFHFVLSKDNDLCEECGQYKPVIVMAKKSFYLSKLKRKHPGDHSEVLEH